MRRLQGAPAARQAEQGKERTAAHMEERAAAGWVRGRGCGAARHSKDEEGAVAGLMPGGVVGVEGIFGIYT
jgi:hypothetical protein